MKNRGSRNDRHRVRGKELVMLDIISTIIKHCESRKSVCYASNVKRCEIYDTCPIRLGIIKASKKQENKNMGQ